MVEAAPVFPNLRTGGRLRAVAIAAAALDPVATVGPVALLRVVPDMRTAIAVVDVDAGAGIIIIIVPAIVGHPVAAAVGAVRITAVPVIAVRVVIAAIATIPVAGA